MKIKLRPAPEPVARESNKGKTYTGSALPLHENWPDGRPRRLWVSVNKAGDAVFATTRRGVQEQL